GQPFGRDRLGGLAVSELAASHATPELDDLLPEATDPSWTTETEARVVGLLVLGVATGWADQRGESADRPASGDLEPFPFGVGGGHGGEEPELRPVEDALGERRTEPRKPLEPRADRRKALELAARDAQALAAVVPEAGEAELVVPAAGEEAPRERAEDHPALRLPGGEPPEPAVEHEGRLVRGEGPTVGLGRNQNVRGYIHATKAKNSRT